MTIVPRHLFPCFDFALDQQAILNEPAGFTSSSYLATTRQFTIDAYYAARYPWASQGNNAKSGLLIIYSDAFQPSESLGLVN